MDEMTNIITNDMTDGVNSYYQEPSNVASMAIMYELEHDVRIPVLFPLLPVCRKSDEEKGEGDIDSIRLPPFTRGVDNKKGYMKNTIILDLYIPKRVSIKININKIHVCGTKDKKTARTAAEMVLKEINYIQNILNQLKDKDSAEYEEYVEILTELECIKSSPTTVTENRKEIHVHRIHPNAIEILESRFNNSRLLRFITNQLMDYIRGSYRLQYYEHFLYQMIQLPTFSIMDTQELNAIVDERINMLNYNYILDNIPESIDRKSVIEAFIQNDITVIADNRIKQNILVIIDDDKFTIHRNGKVSHSGNGEASMTRSFQIFSEIINSVKHRELFSGQIPLEEVLA